MQNVRIFSPHKIVDDRAKTETNRHPVGRKKRELNQFENTAQAGEDKEIFRDL